MIWLFVASQLCGLVCAVVAVAVVFFLYFHLVWFVLPVALFFLSVLWLSYYLFCRYFHVVSIKNTHFPSSLCFLFVSQAGWRKQTKHKINNIYCDSLCAGFDLNVHNVFASLFDFICAFRSLSIQLTLTICFQPMK